MFEVGDCYCGACAVVGYHRT